MKKNLMIDILPMACVGLLLVIMMVVVAPMVMSHNRTPVQVPLTHTSERKVEEDLTVTLTIEGKLFLDDEPITRTELEDKLEEIFINDPYRLTVIRADRETFHKDVLDIIALVKNAGGLRIACATKKRKGIVGSE